MSLQIELHILLLDKEFFELLDAVALRHHDLFFLRVLAHQGLDLVVLRVKRSKHHELL